MFGAVRSNLRVLCTTLSRPAPLVLVDRIPAGKDGHIAQITFNNPRALNAMDIPLGEAFLDAITTVSAEDGLRAVLVTGAGRAFSAGGDLDFLEDRPNHSQFVNTRTMHTFYSRFLRLRDCPVPVIAAVQGPAVGAGLCVALACDMRVVSRDATLAVTFSSLGISAGMGATHWLPALANHETASLLLLANRRINGEDAVRLGLASECVTAPSSAEIPENGAENPENGAKTAENGSKIPENGAERYASVDGLGGGVAAEETRRAGLRLCEEVAQSSPVAVRAITGLLRERGNALLRDRLVREAEVQATSYAGGDVSEGVTAVREKRKAEF